MDNLTNWYEQVSYADAKKIIQANVKTMARSFIAVGYYLKHIRDKELYLEDGYKSIWEFAQDIYGMSRSTASRWMSMNDKFSGGGNSPILDDRYKDFGKSQLQEMLSLPAEQLEEVTPDMTVKEIRQIGKPEAAKKEEQTSTEEVCATSHTEEEEQLPGQMDVQDYPEMAPEPEQQKEKMCSRYDGYTCNIEAVVKKHFTRRGNIEGCAGCCGICRGKGECEYTCKAVKEQITVQEPVKTVSGEVEDTAPEEIETLVNEPQFTSLFLKDILWDKEQELQQMEACNAQPDGKLPERMMQEHRAVVAGLRLLLELMEKQESEEESEED